jgi:hypothetical protein
LTINICDVQTHKVRRDIPVETIGCCRRGEI